MYSKNRSNIKLFVKRFILNLTEISCSQRFLGFSKISLITFILFVKDNFSQFIFKYKEGLYVFVHSIYICQMDEMKIDSINRIVKKILLIKIIWLKCSIVIETLIYFLLIYFNLSEMYVFYKKIKLIS